LAGPNGFDMVPTAQSGVTGLAHRCFEVTQGSGHYVYDAGFHNMTAPSWLKGLDIVPESQLGSPFSSVGETSATYPATEGSTVSETAACVRIAYDAMPVGGEPLNMFFYGMEFEGPTFSGSAYDSMSAWKGFTFNVVPPTQEPDDEDEGDGNGIPAPIIGAAELGPTSALAGDPYIEYFPGNENVGPQLGLIVTLDRPHTDQYGTSPDSGYCFQVTGGHGNFIYTLAVDVYQPVSPDPDDPTWHLDFEPYVGYPPGRVSVLPNYVTTTNREVCITHWIGGNPDTYGATMTLAVYDFPTPGSKPNMSGATSALRATFKDFIDWGDGEAPVLDPPG